MHLSLSIEEKYLVGKASESDVIQYFQNMRKDSIKSQGAVYTPDWIVSAIIDRINLTSKSQTIIEPSCGHGSFVFPLVKYAMAKFDMNPDKTLEWFKSRVTCTDIDLKTIQELRTIAALFFKKLGVAAVLPDDLDNIICQDGLYIGAKKYDIALGNPPYIRTQGLDPKYLTWLRRNFEVAAKGNIDVYYAFLDRYAEIAARCVFIVPNGCIKAAGAAKLRARVFPKVEEIVDFQSQLIFPNARTYTAIITTDKAHQGPCLWRTSTDGASVSAPWESLTGAEIHKAPRVALSGLATLADSAYALHRDPLSGEFGAQLNGERWPIEADLARPLIKATKIPADISPQAFQRFILFPYEDYAGSGVIDEADMARNYPKAYAYLLAVRARLMERDKGKTKRYPAWYAYGRSQGLHDLSNAQLAIIPTMIGGNSLPRLIDTHALTAAYGAPLFVSGFAVQGTAQERASLIGEEFRKYVRENGTAKPGKDEPFYAISSKHVNAFLARQRQDHPQDKT